MSSGLRVFRIPGFQCREHWGIASIRCDLEMHLRDGWAVVLVVQSEDDSAGGRSIRDSAGRVATAAVKECGLDPTRLIWIEHHPERGPEPARLPETWDLVQFNWNGSELVAPRWFPLTRAAAEEIVRSQRTVAWERSLQ